MIIKNVFNPLRVWSYIYREVSLAAGLGAALSVGGWIAPGAVPALPFATVGLLGSALAIFVAFRNNAAYNRWWEARSQWASLLTASRIFARQIVACTQGQVLADKATEAAAGAFCREMLLRQVAFAQALRVQLRQAGRDDGLAALVSPDELVQLQRFSNPPVYILHRQGLRVKEAMAHNLLGAFDGIVLEPPLAACGAAQAACEKLADTPLPRQYAFFTRVLVWLFILLLPFGLLSLLPASAAGYVWLTPLTVLIAATFSTLDRTGQSLEEPFANRITDVPLTYLCEVFESEVRELLGEQATKPAPAQNGYLW